MLQSSSNHDSESAIRKLLHLDSLRAGGTCIRNEKGWLDNERKIEYSWTICINHSFRGPLYLFAVKFGANTFRGSDNVEELLLGLMHLNTAEVADRSYTDSYLEDFTDPIKEIRLFQLFEGDSHFTLDGVSYTIHIKATNIESKLAFSNPQSEYWKAIETDVWKLARQLAQQSGNEFFLNFVK